jgi:glycosyltransferase involved in cell wall biosynthesis
MRILWHSNASFTGSGYGNQTDIFTKLLVKRGHEVVVSASYGLQGHPIKYDGVRIMPQGFDGFGDDILPAHIRELEPDVTVLLYDVWVFSPDTLRAGVTSWCPVDHVPIPPQVAERLSHCRHVWAMSRFGEREMRRMGFDPFYVPHGVDTEVFKPMAADERAKARESLGLPEGAFVALCVAANKGFPSRKNLPELIKAWAKFVYEHPGSVLYLHSNPLGVHSGLDLERLARFYGLPPESIQFPDPYLLNQGQYGTAYLNAAYNAADVFVLPSSGGGFEIPIMEAQSAGCPIVTTGVTAMEELACPDASYVIEVDPFDGLQYTLQHSEQARVLPSQIYRGLEWGYAHRGDAVMRERARAWSMEWDAVRVADRYMIPALECAAAMRMDGAA